MNSRIRVNKVKKLVDINKIVLLRGRL